MLVYDTSEILRDRTPLEQKLEKHCSELAQRLKIAEARVRELEAEKRAAKRAGPP